MECSTLHINFPWSIFNRRQHKEQFKSALEQFTALTRYQGGDLETIYKRLNDEYEDSVRQTDLVKKRISDIEDISEALFREWETEITQYNNASFKSSSQQKITATKVQYGQLITAMKNTEAKLPPILSLFKDHVLFSKHNLNANAIASLKNELGSMKSDISNLAVSDNKCNFLSKVVS